MVVQVVVKEVEVDAEVEVKVVLVVEVEVVRQVVVVPPKGPTASPASNCSLPQPRTSPLVDFSTFLLRRLFTLWNVIANISK